MIGLQNLVPTTHIKSRYRGLGLIERPIHTKFDNWACILILNVITGNDLDRFTASGTSDIDQNEIIRSKEYNGVLYIWNV